MITNLSSWHFLKVPKVKTKKKLITKESTSSRYVWCALSIPGTEPGNLSEAINSNVSASISGKFRGLYTKNNCLYIRQKEHTFPLEEGEILKPYIRLYIRDICFGRSLAMLRIKIVTIKEEMFQLFYLLWLSDFLPDIRFEVMKRILFLWKFWNLMKIFINTSWIRVQLITIKIIYNRMSYLSHLLKCVVIWITIMNF